MMLSLQPPPPAPVLHILAHLQAAGHEAWLVGGAVRDRVLGRSGGDWDVATSAQPTEVVELFPKVIATGLQHGTVTVVEAGEAVEVTTFRIEGTYTDGRRPDAVSFTRSLEEDLARRDFTVNAMAWDPHSGRFADPFGGRHDLERRLIRAVGAPLDRFTEDGLRALRAVRFAAVLGFAIEPATQHAIARTLGTFRQVSAERVRVELEKILASPRAGWAVGLLRDTGLLGACLPEVDALPEADLARVVRALAACAALTAGQAPGEIPLRFAILLHAIQGDPDGVLRRLRFANDVRRPITALLRLQGEHPHPATDAEVRALVARVTPGLLDDWLRLRSACEGPGPWQALAARIDAIGARQGPHTPGELALDGREVMALTGLAPSRRIGRVQQWLLEQVWQDPTLNTQAALAARLPQALAAVPE